MIESRTYTGSDGKPFTIRSIPEQFYKEPNPFQGGELAQIPLTNQAASIHSKASETIDSVEVMPPDLLSLSPYCDYQSKTKEQSAATQRFFYYENKRLEKLQSQFDSGTIGEARRASDEDNRLVKALQSPTDLKRADYNGVARLYYREWSDEYRLRVDSIGRKPEAPLAMTGERVTERLTPQGQRKIIESGAYVAACHGGFKTFATATLDADARKRVASGETTLGKEISRFFDAINKVKQRGWNWGATKEEISENPELKGRHACMLPEKGAIKYLWVAEAPFVKSPCGKYLDYTKQNYHVHILMDWGVEKEQFRGWAKRIERAWQNGYVTLEKIKNQKAASHYVLKALGYVAKSGTETHFPTANPDEVVCQNTGEVILPNIEWMPSQGFIAGNRYGISRDARAPAWECVSAFENRQMGQIIFEMGQELAIRKGKLNRQLEEAKTERSKAIGELAKAKNYKNENARTKTRESGEARLKRAEARINALYDKKAKQPISNKYQLTLKGYAQVTSFLKMAVLQKGWLPKNAKYAEHFKGQLCKFTKAQVDRIYDSLKHAKTDLERYWQHVLHDGEPPEAIA